MLHWEDVLYVLPSSYFTGLYVHAKSVQGGDMRVENQIKPKNEPQG